MTSGLAASEASPVEDIGRALFFDLNLSHNRTLSCATCHAPEHAFTDLRDNEMGRALSLGDDRKSFGDRNAPSIAYAAYSPKFVRSDNGKYIGGQFLDGRARDLVDQAKMPMLNPIEMGMPDETSVVNRLQENPFYVTAFKKHYGEHVFDNPRDAYQAMAESIAAFEKTEFFAPFDSKYDRYLRGEYRMTDLEELGMTLFFSQQFTNCNICHQLQPVPRRESETFTNYEFHNIGVPENPKVREFKGANAYHVDNGLLENPMVDDVSQAGKFKVPSLRNVAITAPYMHNGVFQDLRTVILFYNKYNSKSAKRQINPETGEKWSAPEVSANISIKELETGPALDDHRVDALIAFLQTLTDRRYEGLLKN